MKVFCGFTDPIICPAPQGAAPIEGEACHLNDITKDIYPVGKIVKEDTLLPNEEK